MQNQKHLFDLPDDLRYLNCAYMSPQLKSVTEIGIQAVRRKSDPSSITAGDFFTEKRIAESLFGKIVNAPAEQIAVIPSVSYGIQSALNNVSCSKGQHAVTISKEFPSGYFALKRWCDENKAELKIIESDHESDNIGKDWNDRILTGINSQTAALVLSSVHWMDGTKFDLEAIGNRCREFGTALIVDGTQSTGAMFTDVKQFKIDALICGGYKWLMCPYSMGFAYFGERFSDGTPIEESWMNRTNAEEFSKLSDYEAAYKAGAARYSVGQSSHFIQMPMAIEALRQILKWNPENIQNYCQKLTLPLIGFVRSVGVDVTDETYRSNHLIGLRLPGSVNQSELADILKKENIVLSYRGNSIRIAPNVYNTPADISALTEALKQAVSTKVII